MILKLYPGMIGNVTWQFPDGNIPGIAVGSGDYMALIAVDPKQKSGVALYSMADDAKTATSRWTMMGAGGVGEEKLKVTSASPTFFTPESSDGAVAIGASAQDEVRIIAEELREDWGNAAKYKPTTPEINAISASLNDAESLRAYTEKVYAQIPQSGATAKNGQTEIIISGPDLKDLPGGYGNKIKHFRSGVEFYRFKYVEPGQDIGMSYDGLIKVKGRWVFIPKAWRAFQ